MLMHIVRFLSLKSFECEIACDMANSKAGTALYAYASDEKHHTQPLLDLHDSSRPLMSETISASVASSSKCMKKNDSCSS
jgi:hypothetical protein